MAPQHVSFDPSWPQCIRWTLNEKNSSVQFKPSIFVALHEDPCSHPLGHGANILRYCSPRRLVLGGVTGFWCLFFLIDPCCARFDAVGMLVNSVLSKFSPEFHIFSNARSRSSRGVGGWYFKLEQNESFDGSFQLGVVESNLWAAPLAWMFPSSGGWICTRSISDQDLLLTTPILVWPVPFVIDWYRDWSHNC
jgi:hypothetical protein